jgi:CRP/FNR family transcriptional regulator, cyclic AMP receptor protein
MASVDPEQHLRPIFLFSGLDEAALQSLAEAMTVKEYLPDDQVLTEGHDGYHGGMGVVLHGSLSVIHAEHDVIGHLGDGDVFGEMSLIDDEPRSATLSADEHTEVALLSRGEFRALIRQNPDIALRLMKILSGRLREAHVSMPTRLDESANG